MAGVEAVQLRLEPGSRWQVGADLPGFWVRRQPLVVGAGGETTHLTLDLWPLGEVSGRLRIEPDPKAPGEEIELPRRVQLKTVPLPSFRKARDTPPGVVPCPVSAAGDFRCVLPGGTFDLVITADGFTPAYRWEAKVPPAGALELGTISLRRGASVAAWVAVEGGKIDPERCVARLTPAVACGADPAAQVRLERTAFKAAVSGDGFVQLRGLAPGTYSLEVLQPGYAPARVPALRVSAGQETFLAEPLFLVPPVTLEVRVVPALDPWGEPWRGSLVHPSDGSSRAGEIAFQGLADEAGSFTVLEQAAGPFVVRLADSRGNRVFSEERRLLGGAPATIEIERLRVEGQLQLGDRPLAGRLVFGGTHGSRKVAMEADEEGAFAGFLPAAGHWLVDIAAEDPPFAARLFAEVQAAGEGTAFVELTLPDNRVFGRVIDGEGRPAPGSWVVTAGTEVPLQTLADGEGRFELRSLPAGRVYLGAEAEGIGTSELVPLTVEDEGEQGPIELRLKALRRVTGTVVSAQGPVVGARVTLVARPPAAGSATAVSGSDGSFSLALPGEVRTAVALAGGAGYALGSLPVTLDGTPLRLLVSAQAGRLELDLPLSEDEFFRHGLQPALFQHGVEVTAPLLAGGNSRTVVASEERTVLAVSNLAPGEYALCVVPRRQRSPGEGLPAGPEAACAAGFLRQDETLSLRPLPSD